MDSKMTRFDPFAGMTRWGDTLDQFFSDFWTKEQPAATRNLLSPAIDVAEDKGALTVTAELPGLEKSDIHLEVKDGVLVLRGEKKFEEESKDKNFHRIERRYGSFYRALALPDTVDTAKVEAAFKNGVLKVRMPKREESKPKPIQIHE
ncbi:MAG: Hsp20/alpha crystallin family protein [Candidatus Brocadiae bacterium]|nr:Hsp20/alpha crystallin family protein [Candidatus Brocadiia bacterium]